MLVLTTAQQQVLDALRSGDYTQGVGAMRNARDEYCCLGVMCDVLAPDRWDHAPPWTTPRSNYVHLGPYEGPGSTTHNSGSPHTDYTAHLGLPEIIVADLVQLNDQLRASFDDIANILEAYWTDDNPDRMANWRSRYDQYAKQLEGVLCGEVAATPTPIQEEANMPETQFDHAELRKGVLDYNIYCQRNNVNPTYFSTLMAYIGDIAVDKADYYTPEELACALHASRSIHEGNLFIEDFLEPEVEDEDYDDEEDEDDYKEEVRNKQALSECRDIITNFMGEVQGYMEELDTALVGAAVAVEDAIQRLHMAYSALEDDLDGKP